MEFVPNVLKIQHGMDQLVFVFQDLVILMEFALPVRQCLCGLVHSKHVFASLDTIWSMDHV